MTVDAEEHPEARIIYGIERYPTIRLFLDGRMVEEYEGKRSLIPNPLTQTPQPYTLNHQPQTLNPKQ